MGVRASEGVAFRRELNPEENRRDSVVHQVLQRIPRRGVAIDVFQLFNDITCNIEYPEFREILAELEREGQIAVTESAVPDPEDRNLLDPGARELLERVERRR